MQTNYASSKKKITFICFLLWISVFILYFQTINFEFVGYDDHLILLKHPNLYNENSFLSSLYEIVYNYFPREEPLILRDITWAIDSYIYGFKNPFGYHLGNIILHCFNVVLLFIFLFLNNRQLFTSLIITITFSVLPVHVEPVCWVMGRKDLLASFFMLLALISQTIYLDLEDKKKRRTFYFMTLLFTILALISKINTVTFFLVLAVHQYFYPFLNRSNALNSNSITLKHLYKKIIPGILPHFFISICIFLWYKNILTSWGILGKSNHFLLEHIKNLILFNPSVIFLYLKHLLFPFQLSISYDWPNANIPYNSLHIILSICSSFFILFSLIITFLKRKDLFFYIIVFFILMIPYLNIIYVGIWIANRYIYFSSFCIIVLILTILIEQIFKQKKIVKITMFCFWVLFIFINIFQNINYQKAWKNDLSLWTYETELKKPSIVALYSLSKAYVRIARNEPDTILKLDFLNKAEAALQKFFDKFNSLNLQKTNFFSSEVLYYSEAYHVKGIIADLKNQSKEIQIQYYKKSYDILRTEVNIFTLAKTYLNLSMETKKSPKREDLARKGFGFLEEYIYDCSSSDYFKNKKALLMLNYYWKHFPFLEKKIIRAQNFILNKMKKN